MNKGYLLTIGTAIISGLSLYLNKFGVSVVNPYIFTGLKNLVVVFLLILLIIGWKKQEELRHLGRKQWRKLIAVGLVGGGVPFLLFFKGLSLTSAAQGAFIHKTLFIWAAILAVVFLREKLNRWSFLGLVSLLGGLILVSQIKLETPSWGDGLVLIATLLWSVEQIIAKKALADISALVVVWGRLFFGLIVIGGFLAVTSQLGPVSALSWRQISWVAITAVFLLGYSLTWYSGLKRISVIAAASILTLGFPITVLIQTVFDKTLLSLGQISGLVFFTAGVVFLIVNQRSKKLTPSYN